MNEKAPDKGPTGLSIASLVTGILSSIPGCGIAAIVCGAIDLNKQKAVKEMNISKGFDIAGIALGALSIVAGIIFAIAAIVAVVLGFQNYDVWGIPIQSFM
jgi:hypothetical protein